MTWIVLRELTRKKNTVYEQAQNNTHRKMQKQYDKNEAKVYAAVEGAKNNQGWATT